MGVGGRSSYNRPGGTDFSRSTTKTTEDWEEVKLKKQLADLEAKIEVVEKSSGDKFSASSSRGRRERSKPALVKRELELLLEYKRKELRELELGEGRSKVGASLKGLEEEIGVVREQVEGLEAHLRARGEVLEGLRREVEAERRGR